MKTVSVINYKGGVGKTTVTANLGAELAFRGKSVLLLDVDPQTSLTFSFYPAEEWRTRLAPRKTVKRWFDDLISGARNEKFTDLAVTPEKVNREIHPQGGRLDLIASHLGLIDIDVELYNRFGGGLSPDLARMNYLRMHTCLAEGLREAALEGYDYALIDCPPNFGVVTRTAIVASSHILVPAKADYLSTLGIDYLSERVTKLSEDYNQFVAMPTSTSTDSGFRRIDPLTVGVVFTMVGFWGGRPIAALSESIEKVRQRNTVFDVMLRENKTDYGSASQSGVPVVLARNSAPNTRNDLEELTNEFLTRIQEGSNGGRN